MTKFEFGILEKAASSNKYIKPGADTAKKIKTDIHSRSVYITLNESKVVYCTYLVTVLIYIHLCQHSFSRYNFAVLLVGPREQTHHRVNSIKKI